jgi:hypothetical protein
MRFFILLLACIFSFSGFTQNISEKPIPVGHSHNDYNKQKPLWGALEHGLTSIEIDVFAHKNELKVAHVGVFLNVRKNIVDMYLKPLSEILQNREWIYQNHHEPLVLMIDFKTDSEETLQLLLRDIEPYKELFTYFYKDEVHLKPLQLVVSGRGFSFNQVENQDSVYVFLDGSVAHCEKKFPEQLVPRGSASYSRHFKWNGKGKIADDELEKLKNYVDVANSCNKKLRFYAMKHNTAIWETFLNAGAGWINIDKPKKFADFYWNTYIPNQSEAQNKN